MGYAESREGAYTQAAHDGIVVADGKLREYGHIRRPDAAAVGEEIQGRAVYGSGGQRGRQVMGDEGEGFE